MILVILGFFVGGGFSEKSVWRRQNSLPLSVKFATNSAWSRAFFGGRSKMTFPTIEDLKTKYAVAIGSMSDDQFWASSIRSAIEYVRDYQYGDLEDRDEAHRLAVEEVFSTEAQNHAGISQV